MQTILGSGGAIGTELAKALTSYTKHIRLVGRHPRKVNDSDELFAADLTNAEAVMQAVKGSEVAYLVAGLKYETKVWQATWPVIMRNTIEACITHQCRLVFFDNIYMYDANHLGNMTEETPIDPPSEKGKVRASLVNMIWEAVEQKGLVACIARCADYYGPSITNTSLLTETVFKPLQEGKTATWLMSDKFVHAFTYTPDAGRATALLGNTQDAFGQTWHLPTAKAPFTGKEWVKQIALAMGKRPKYRVAGRWMVRLLGVFIPVMKETVEMLYQYDRPYVFNSDKFEQKFSFRPTPYMQGIAEIVKADYT